MKEAGKIMTLNANILIEQPADVVYTFISDYKNDWKWRSLHMEVPNYDNNTKVRVNRSIKNFHLLGLMKNGSYRIIDDQPYEQISSRINFGKLTITDTRKIKCIQMGQTELEYNLKFTLHGIFKLFSPILMPDLKKDIIRDLKWLKEILEIFPSPHTSPVEL